MVKWALITAPKILNVFSTIPVVCISQYFLFGSHAIYIFSVYKPHF